MDKQIVEITRTPETKPISMETLLSLISNIRLDTKWEVREISSKQPDIADKKCICEYPYINVIGCPKCNPSKLVPVG